MVFVINSPLWIAWIAVLFVLEEVEHALHKLVALAIVLDGFKWESYYYGLVAVAA